MITAEDDAEAQAQFQYVRRARVRLLYRGPSGRLTDDEVESILDSGRASQVEEMTRFTGVGTPDQVLAYVKGFAADTGADEVMVVPQGATSRPDMRPWIYSVRSLNQLGNKRRGTEPNESVYSAAPDRLLLLPCGGGVEQLPLEEGEELPDRLGPTEPVARTQDDDCPGSVNGETAGCR